MRSNFYLLQGYSRSDYGYLKTPEFQIEDNDVCFQFSYFMYAHRNQAGDTARFLVTLHCGSDKETELFRESSSPVRKWNRAFANIKGMSGKECQVCYRFYKEM